MASLQRGSHSNSDLQLDWIKTGKEGFAFEILEVVKTAKDVQLVEQKWLDRLFDFSIQTYNIRTQATHSSILWKENKKMSRGFFRGWAMRPGRYERKESNIRTDVLMPILQGIVCVLILSLDLLFVGSWIFILPPELDWILGMILFWSIWSAALIGNWIFIRLLPWSLPGRWMPKLVGSRMRQKRTWIPCVVIEVGILFLMWSHVWDWWWLQCLKYPDITIPVPSAEGITGFFVLGLFISFVGMIGIVLHPSKYALGLTAFGGFVSTVSHLVSPVTVRVTHERPFILYAVWVVWCIAWVLGTATLFFRFWVKEIPDPYVPEITARVPVSEPGWEVKPGGATGPREGI